jgi:beta-mannosidase
MLCSVSQPRLTAMDHGLTERARLATDLLFQLIEGSTSRTGWSPVGTLLVRESTGPALPVTGAFLLPDLRCCRSEAPDGPESGNNVSLEAEEVSAEALTGWTLQALDGPAPPEVTGRTLPATVPGTVHTDLLAAGLDPGPVPRRRTKPPSSGSGGRAGGMRRRSPPRRQRKASTSSWCSTGSTRSARSGSAAQSWPPAEPASRIPLRRHGSRSDRRDGARHRLRSPARRRRGGERGAGPARPRGQRPPVSTRFARRPATSGWDWGPDLVTAGIWRSARIERWRTARLAAVRTLVTVVDGVGRVEVQADAVGTPSRVDSPVTCEGRSAEANVDKGETSVVLDVPEPRLWWPRGYGAQPLSDVHVELLADGTVVDRREHGSASAKSSWTPGRTPRARRSRCASTETRPRQGANWIPDDCFPHRVDHARYAARSPTRPTPA